MRINFFAYTARSALPFNFVYTTKPPFVNTDAEEQHARLQASAEALRLRELAQGFPYMIGPTPENPAHFYYEFSDDRIAVVYFPQPSAGHEVIRWLPVREAKRMRTELALVTVLS